MRALATVDMILLQHLRGRLQGSIRVKLVLMVLLPLWVVLPILLGLMVYSGSSFINGLLSSKVRSDLGIAREYVRRVQDNMGIRLAGLAESQRVVGALDSPEVLSGVLTSIREEAGLDFLSLHPLPGSALNPAGEERNGGYPAWSLLMHAAGGTADTAIDILRREELDALSPDLAGRAEIPLAEGGGRLTDGLIMHAATPVLDADGYIVAVLHGGVLLNRNLNFVDTINSVVYREGSLPLNSQGTATLFLHDVRVATNVRQFGGERALGTRVSDHVRRHVLEQGRIWSGEAFVVNDWYVSGYQPLYDSGGRRIGMLYVGFLAQPLKTAWQVAQGALVALFILISLMGSLWSLIWARRVFQPLERMSETMQAASAGDTAARVGQVDSQDEIGHLARHFDALLNDLGRRNAELQRWAHALDQKVAERTQDLERANEELQAAQSQLVRSEKLAALGQLTAGVAHEINNPIAVIQGNVDVLREVLGRAADPVATEIRLIDDQVDRIRALVAKLLQYARPGDYAGFVEEVDVNAAVEDCVVLVDHLLKKSAVRIERAYGTSEKIRINRSELQQVIINLMVNAVHAMPEGGVLRLATFPWGTRGVVIAVADTGQGIAPDRLNRIFDPFYTTKKQGGSGLGLSISQSLVERYGGSIEVHSELGQGSVFEVCLPRDPLFSKARPA